MPYGRSKYRRRAGTRTRTNPTRLTRRKKSTVLAKARTTKFNRAVRTVVARQQEIKRMSNTCANGLNPPVGTAQIEGLIKGGGVNFRHGDSPAGLQHGFSLDNVVDHLLVFQGTSNTQRVGNAIRVKHCYLRGMVSSLPFDMTSNNVVFPYTVHMMLVKYRIDRVPPADPALKLATTQSPPLGVALDGTALNNMLPFNTAQWKVMKGTYRHFRLRPTHSGIAATPSIDAGLNTQMSNAPMYRYFSIRVPLPKVLKFHGNSGVSPTTYMSYICWITDPTGQALDPGQRRAQIFMKADLTYTE